MAINPNHYLFSISKEVDLISEPLKKNRINYFGYSRCFNDGLIYFLISNEKLCQHHLEHDYPLVPVIPKKFVKKMFFYIALPDANDHYSQAVYDFKNLFNINQPIFFFEKNDNYTDIFFYSCLGDNTSETVNFYLNYISEFNKFKLYFKEKAQKLIGEANKHKIYIPESMRANLIQLYDNFPTDKRQSTQGLLTQRQKQCLYYLVRGKSFKEVAKILMVSPRTVECHLETIKKNLKCKYTSEVIEKVIDDGFLNDF